MPLGMVASVRTERTALEKETTVFGLQEWFRRAATGLRAKPRESYEGVTWVRVLIRSWSKSCKYDISVGWQFCEWEISHSTNHSLHEPQIFLRT